MNATSPDANGDPTPTTPHKPQHSPWRGHLLLSCCAVLTSAGAATTAIATYRVIAELPAPKPNLTLLLLGLTVITTATALVLAALLAARPLLGHEHTVKKFRLSYFSNTGRRLVIFAVSPIIAILTFQTLVSSGANSTAAGAAALGLLLALLALDVSAQSSFETTQQLARIEAALADLNAASARTPDAGTKRRRWGWGRGSKSH